MYCWLFFCEKMFKLGIVGGRNYTDYESFKTHIDDALEKWNISINDIEFVVSGGARGADSLAELWAKEKKIKIKIYKPDWKNLGNKAGPLRNTDIVNASTHLIAFPTQESVGTWDSIRKAEKREIPLEIVRIK